MSPEFARRQHTMTAFRQMLQAIELMTKLVIREEEDQIKRSDPEDKETLIKNVGDLERLNRAVRHILSDWWDD